MRSLLLLLLFASMALGLINYTTVFDRYVQVWKFGDFWKRANTVDAALHFVSAVGDKYSSTWRNTTLDILSNNLDYYYKSDYSSAWADDFGWWGLLGVRAYTYLRKIGNTSLALKYKALANHSWHMMLKTGYDYNNTYYGPDPVPYGCTNSDSIDKSGSKNTVTNALLLLLSIRLYRTFGNIEYLTMVKAQWLWFSRWFQLKEFHYLAMIDDQTALIQPNDRITTESNSALIQERPLGGNYTNIYHPKWAEGLVWSGDQGLILAALNELPANLVLAQISYYIGRGIRQALVGPDLIFREAPFHLIYTSDNARDYVGGRGIMVRNLDCKTIAHFQLTGAINATINAMWKAQVKGQFVLNFTTPADDLKYQKYFCNLWGQCDDVMNWNILWSSSNERDAVTQALGIDFLATAIECGIL